MQKQMSCLLLFVIFILMVGAPVCAMEKKFVNNVNVISTDNSLTVDLPILKEKLNLLNQRFEQSNQCWTSILSSQATNYTISAGILGVVVAVSIALIGYFNFSYLRKEVDRDINDIKTSYELRIKESEETIRKILNDSQLVNERALLASSSELKKELANTIEELRKYSADAVQDLRKEFSQSMQSKIENVSENINNKFKAFEEKYSNNLTYLEAQNYNALGRIYEESKSYSTSGLWYLRGVNKYIEWGVDQDWTRKQILTVVRLFKLEGDLVRRLSSHKNEIYEITSKIPENNYKKEKDELMALLKDKFGV